MQDVCDKSMKQSKCIITKIEIISGNQETKSRFQVSKVETEFDQNQLQEIQESLSESQNVENSVETKMKRISDTLKQIKGEMKDNWKIMINEDLLLSRIETLEEQLIKKKEDAGKFEILKDRVLRLENLTWKVIKSQNSSLQINIFTSAFVCFLLILFLGHCELIMSKRIILNSW